MMNHSPLEDDLASSDEIKVYKDEGEEDEQTKSSENLIEEKLNLVHEGEKLSFPGPAFLFKNEFANLSKFPFSDPRLSNYLFNPYAATYVNGVSSPNFRNKVPLVPDCASPFSLVSLYMKEAFGRPPPAHIGAGPLEIKTGLHRSAPMYNIGTPPPGQFPGHSVPVPYSTDFSHWQAAAAGVGSPGYAPTMRSSYTSGPNSIMNHPGLTGRFSPSSMLAAHHAAGVMPSMHQAPGAAASSHHHSLMSDLAAAVSGAASLRGEHPVGLHAHHPSHHAMSNHHTEAAMAVAAGIHMPGVNHYVNHHQMHDHHRSEFMGGMKIPVSEPEKPKKPHIKKPLNAFMLFMKEMRAKVVAECTLKESAAINQILGRKWHALSRDDQAKYYEMARKEKELHQQLYPGWSARDNYAIQVKRKKKRKLAQVIDNSSSALSMNSLDAKGDCSAPKKCRARYGLDQQNQWCKPCRRKKKCIRFLSDGEEEVEEDDLGDTCKSLPQSPDSEDATESDVNAMHFASESEDDTDQNIKIESIDENQNFGSPSINCEINAPISPEYPSIKKNTENSSSTSDLYSSCNNNDEDFAPSIKIEESVPSPSSMKHMHPLKRSLALYRASQLNTLDNRGKNCCSREFCPSSFNEKASSNASSNSTEFSINSLMKSASSEGNKSSNPSYSPTWQST